MFKLALIGGAEIKKYTVADVMWQHISDVSGIPLNFEVIPLTDESETRKFYEAFKRDPSFVGFNVALPWKRQFAEYIAEFGQSDQSIINTVYKHDRMVFGANTDPLGLARGLAEYDLCDKSVLILGAGGAGQAAAQYIHDVLGAKVYIYDIADFSSDIKQGIWLVNYKQLSEHTYDVIINATPIGKYYLDRAIQMFASPIDFQLMQEITHSETILQEMNYLPLDTLFLQLGQAINLHTISGEKMLVYQAAESFNRYFNSKLDSDQISEVINKMQDNISKQKSAILRIETNQ